MIPTAVRTEGPGPRVLLESEPDSASRNIADHLRDVHDLSDTGITFGGSPVQRFDGTSPEVYLVTIPEWHISREGIGEDLAAALGTPIEAILVLSRHRAASGVPSFTAHPVGNPGAEAIAGGRPYTATPTHPHLLSASLRALQRAAAETDLPHTVTLEATHHGPETAVPIVFIEIGSDDTHWTDPDAGGVVARAAYEAATMEFPDVPVVVGIGGGHYAPRFVGLLSDAPVSVGHMLASYHWKDEEGVSREVLERFLEASRAPGASRPFGAYVDRKSLPGPHRRAVLEHLEALDVPVVRTQDLLEATGRGAV